MSSGEISTPSVVAAFGGPIGLNVGEGGRGREAELRQGVLHLSAPSIYGTALEPRPPTRHSKKADPPATALARTILGPRAVQFGVRVPRRARLARAVKLDALGTTTRPLERLLARSAGLDAIRAHLRRRRRVARTAASFRMLEIGGVIVGPFAGAHGTQRGDAHRRG